MEFDSPVRPEKIAFAPAQNNSMSSEPSYGRNQSASSNSNFNSNPRSFSENANRNHTRNIRNNSNSERGNSPTTEISGEDLNDMLDNYESTLNQLNEVAFQKTQKRYRVCKKFHAFVFQKVSKHFFTPERAYAAGDGGARPV